MLHFSPPDRIKPRPQSGNIHIDIRQEMDDLFYGSCGTPGFSFECILRKVDKTQRCYCWNELKEEADTRCKRCSGSGWHTDNLIVDTVKRKFVGRELRADFGKLESDSTMFYFLHDIKIVEEDSILEVSTDEDGKIQDRDNFEIIKRYEIRDMEIYRGNNGRHEYSRCYCSKSE